MRGTSPDAALRSMTSLSGFVEDLKVVGNRLSQARDSYDEAYGKLSTGQANLVKQAELLESWE